MLDIATFLKRTYCVLVTSANDHIFPLSFIKNANSIVRATAIAMLGLFFTQSALAASQLCPSTSTNNTYEWIGSVTIAGTNYVSDPVRTNYYDHGEANLVDLSGFAPGDPVPIEIEISTRDEPSSTWPEYVAVWIDADSDDLTGEGSIVDLVFSEVRLGVGSIVGSFPMPASIKDNPTVDTVDTRMRVVLEYNFPPSPCDAAFNFGEVEDFYVRIPVIQGEVVDGTINMNANLEVEGNLSLGGAISNPTANAPIAFTSPIQIISNGLEMTGVADEVGTGRLTFTSTPGGEPVFGSIAVQAQEVTNNQPGLFIEGPTVPADNAGIILLPTRDPASEGTVTVFGHLEFSDVTLAIDPTVGVGSFGSIHVERIPEPDGGALSTFNITGASAGGGIVITPDPDDRGDSPVQVKGDLDVTGALTVDGVPVALLTGGTVQPSDRNLKQDITPIGNVLENILKLKPSTYRMKDDTEAAHKSMGFIAQEVETLFPELVRDIRRTTKDGVPLKGLTYDSFAVLAIAAIQEQQQQIERLQSQLLAQNLTLEDTLKQVVALKREWQEAGFVRQASIDQAFIKHNEQPVSKHSQ